LHAIGFRKKLRRIASGRSFLIAGTGRQLEGELVLRSREGRLLDFQDRFGEVGSAKEGKMAVEAFSERHGIHAAPNLTVLDDEIAALIVERLEPRISGKTVVEIGGGIGLLSLRMATVAKRVYCI